MIVVDASVTAAALLVDTDQGLRAEQRLASEPDLHAPHLIDLEVLAAVRNRLRRGQLRQERAYEAVESLADLPIRRYSHVPLLPRIWELRDTVSPYDAAYVALAEVLGAPLLTADARLAGAPGTRCAVELLA